MSLVVVRVAVVALALLALGAAIRWRERTGEIVRRFWFEKTSPVNAAVLRIVLFAMLLRSALGQNPIWYAGFPRTERDLPWGWGWLGSIPFDERLISGAQDALIVAAAAAVLGLFTRVSAPLAALLAVYVFGLPNFFAKINHAHHARVLCALALAFSPCGDALSLDRLFERLRGRAKPVPSAAYTIPVRVVWVLIGTTYFFPGFWKLWQAGDLWITGRQLEFELHTKWAALPDFVPLYRIDEHAWLLALLGVATLVFELGFVFALVNRTTRTVAALSAVGFHLGIGAFMGIYFHAFFPLIVLIEIPERWKSIRGYVPEAVLALVSSFKKQLEERGKRLRAIVSPASEPRPRSSPSPWPAVAVGVALLSGQTLAGFAELHSWPISVYPTFSNRARTPPKVGSVFRVVLEAEGEKPVDLGRKLKRMGPARLQKLLRGLDKQLSGKNAKRSGRSLLDLFRLSRVQLEAGDHVVVYEARWDVLPPGKRNNHREVVSGRYVVTKDGSLAVVR